MFSVDRCQADSTLKLATCFIGTELCEVVIITYEQKYMYTHKIKCYLHVHVSLLSNTNTRIFNKLNHYKENGSLFLFALNIGSGKETKANSNESAIGSGEFK